MTYTDTQLKQTLAKMLPEKVVFDDESKNIWFATNERKRITGMPVLDTELLHLCWLVAQRLNETQQQSVWHLLKRYLNPSWQQRTIALAKTLNIEIV